MTFYIRTTEVILEQTVLESFYYNNRLFVIHFFYDSYTVSDYISGMSVLKGLEDFKSAKKKAIDVLSKHLDFDFNQYNRINFDSLIEDIHSYRLTKEEAKFYSQQITLQLAK